MLLVGPQDVRTPVARALDGLRVRLHPVDRVDADRAAPLGVVRVQTDDARAVLGDVRALRERWPDVALHVVVPDDPADAHVARLYAAGASGVFEWPRERELLARHLAEMLSLRLTRGPARRGDVALARVVRSHLRTLSLPGERPRVRAREGVVQLGGEVDSLARRREIERCVESVPGVRGLDASGLYVLPDPVPDASIRGALRRLLARSPGVEDSTLEISVDGGQVTLTGTAAERRELEHVEELAARIRGVRDVELRVLVSPGAQRRDRGAAARLRRVLVDLFPDEGELRLAFFRGVAVLSGRVRNLRARRSIEAFVAEDPSVERVVNKLDVGVG